MPKDLLRSTRSHGGGGNLEPELLKHQHPPGMLKGFPTTFTLDFLTFPRGVSAKPNPLQNNPNLAICPTRGQATGEKEEKGGSKPGTELLELGSRVLAPTSQGQNQP